MALAAAFVNSLRSLYTLYESRRRRLPLCHRIFPTLWLIYLFLQWRERFVLSGPRAARDRYRACIASERACVNVYPTWIDEFSSVL